jgi:hypothetical protein
MASIDWLIASPPAVYDTVRIWQADGSRYGLEARFSGATDPEGAERYETELTRQGVRCSLRPESDGGWTIHCGPLRASDVAGALAALQALAQHAASTPAIGI